MIKSFLRGSGILSLLVLSSSLIANAQTLYVIPETVQQGEPLMVQVQGVSSITDIGSMVFNGKTILPFTYTSTPTALIGIDLNEKPRAYTLVVTLKNGNTLSKDILVQARQNIEVPLGIPEKLGGNTPQSEKNLVTALAKENALLLSIPTSKKQLWTKNFIYPVLDPVVVDPYGYQRLTGEYTIAHKGTDFRAPTGTNVYAMNRGIVRVAKTSPVYGKMVVIDHGLGLMTFYLHLSKINVHKGDIVEQGIILGKSGHTGYALSPHLHLTVRINNISIDPVKFLAFFK